MKIALLLSGHSRSFETTYPKFRETLLDKYDVDIFFTTWETVGWWSADTITQINPDREFVNVSRIKELYDPVVLDIQNYFGFYEEHFKSQSSKYDHLLKDRRVRLLNPYCSYYKMQRIIKIFEDYTTLTNKTYDVVIRTRPDILLDHLAVTSPEDHIIIDGSQGIDYRGVGDMLQMGKQEHILKLNRLFDDYDEIINQCSLYCPHLYLEKYLEIKQIKYTACQKFTLHNAKNGQYSE